MNPRALLASPLGFLVGVALGALGGGGSIIAVPVLVYAAGESPKAATTTSLLVVGTTAIGGVVAHSRAGRVRVVPGVLFGLAGVGGSLVGSRLNAAVDENLLLLGFAGLMLVAGWRMWVNQVRPVAGGGDDPVGPLPADSLRSTGQPTGEAGSPAVAAVEAPTHHLAVTPALIAKVLVAGTVVGFITGFFGVGGGFVIVPALVLALDFDMPDAVGTSLLVIAINSAVALTMRL